MRVAQFTFISCEDPITVEHYGSQSATLTMKTASLNSRRLTTGQCRAITVDVSYALVGIGRPPGKLERAKGFEPSTLTLARLCSTPELHPHSNLSWRLTI